MCVQGGPLIAPDATLCRRGGSGIMVTDEIIRRRALSALLNRTTLKTYLYILLREILGSDKYSVMIIIITNLKQNFLKHSCVDWTTASVSTTRIMQQP